MLEITVRFTTVMTEVQLLVIIEWRRKEDLVESLKNRRYCH